jgi:hypothetical protein
MSRREESLIEELSSTPRYRRKELLILSVYMLGILICAGWIATMLSRAYGNEGFFFELRWLATSALNVEISTLPALFLGYIFGLVLLIMLDWYKRIHGILLFLGMIAAGLVLLLFRSGTFVTNLSWTGGLTPMMLVLGTVAGFVTGGGLRGIREKPRQFESAFTHLWVLITIFVIIGLLDAHVLYQPPVSSDLGDEIVAQSFQLQGFVGGPVFFADISLSVMLLFLFSQFAGHDTGKQVIVLGPTGSGKTWLLTGIGYVITQEWGKDGFQTEPDGKLVELINKFALEEFDDDVFQGTRGAQYLWFTYPHGNFFRKEIGFQTLDYPGEALKFLEYKDPEEIEATSMSEALEDAQEANTPETIGDKLSEAVAYTDTVATVIPLDDFGDPIEERGNVMYDQGEITPPRGRLSPGEYMTTYHSLASDYKEKDFVPIVTKADLARQDFINETHYDTTLPHYFEFRAHINDSILKTSVKPYLNEIGEDTIYPVYFSVNENDAFTQTGNIKPRLVTDDTQPVLRGSNELLQRLGE